MYINGQKHQGSTLPAKIFTGRSDSVEEVQFNVHEQLGQGWFATAWRVSIAGNSAIGAGSSSSSSGSSFGGVGQEYALKVFTLSHTVKAGTTPPLDNADPPQRHRTSAEDQQHADDGLEADAMDAEQQQQQQPNQVPGHAALGSVQQVGHEQHRCGTAADSGSSSKGAQGEEIHGQHSYLADDGGTTELPNFLQGAPDELKRKQKWCDRELNAMLLAKGDELTARIARAGVDDGSPIASCQA
jgi:hypothetical protein